jgi:hypothetical protein
MHSDNATVLGVNLIAYIRAKMGLGTAARGVANALEAAKIPFHILNFEHSNPSLHRDDSWKHKEATSSGYDFTLFLNQQANLFLRLPLGIKLSEVTNAWEAYRREVIDVIRTLIAPHFNLTVAMPLKAIVRGYSRTVMPITRRNRRSGVAKLKIKEMGSRYLFICLYV